VLPRDVGVLCCLRCSMVLESCAVGAIVTKHGLIGVRLKFDKRCIDQWQRAQPLLPSEHRRSSSHMESKVQRALYLQHMRLTVELIRTNNCERYRGHGTAANAWSFADNAPNLHDKEPSRW